MDADEHRSLAHLPKDGAGTPGRAPVNFQPGVTEATASVADNLTLPVAASGARERNACAVRARLTDLTEEATPQETDRKPTPTEAGKGSIEGQSNQTLFCRLTPELSRPVAGRRMRASVA